jgi:hypothetical protein
MRRLKQEIDRRRPRAWPEEGRLCPTLRAHSAGVCLSGRCARLVQPSRAVVPCIDHNGSGVLRRNAGGYFGSPLRSCSARQTLHLINAGKLFRQPRPPLDRVGPPTARLPRSTRAPSAGKWRARDQSGRCAPIRGTLSRSRDTLWPTPRHKPELVVALSRIMPQRKLQS